MKQREIHDKALAVHDAAINAIHRIEAMAGLMQAAAGGWDGAGPLDALEIEEATTIICEETTRVRDALGLMRGLADSAKEHDPIRAARTRTRYATCSHYLVKKAPSSDPSTSKDDERVKTRFH